MRFLRMCVFFVALCAASLAVQGWTVAEAMFDLTQTSVRYTSLDRSRDEQTFILSYEKVPNYGAYKNTAPHGAYLATCGVDGGTVDFSFDYDGATYTIYEGDGVARAISYDADSDALYVEDYVDGADSGTYYFDDSTQLYTNGESGHTIPMPVARLVVNNYTLGSTYSANTVNGWRDYEVVEYQEEQSTSNLPSKWYKITNESDSSDWIAFTYNASTGIYTMYRPTYDGIEKYSYRRFVDDHTLQVRNAGGGATTGTYSKWNDGKFHLADDSSKIAKYITDGMLIFRNQCVH